MYTHEVWMNMSHEGPAIDHYRGQETPDGLIAMLAIGHTIAIPLEPPIPREHANLVLPCAHEIEQYGSAGSDKTSDSMGTIPDRTVTCDDLDEFVIHGKQAWQDLVNRAGFSVSVQLILAEEREEKMATSPGGVILPHESYSEFSSYVATPDEIEALESITNAVVPQDLFASSGILRGMYV